MCFIIVIWGRKTMRNQQLQTDYTEDMVGYWKERSHTYSKDNRSQLENEKKTVWENLILSNTTQEKQLQVPVFLRCCLLKRDITLRQWMSVLICWNVQKKI